MILVSIVKRAEKVVDNYVNGTNNNLFETIEPTYEKYYSEMNDIFYIFPLTVINILLSLINTIFKMRGINPMSLT